MRDVLTGKRLILAIVAAAVAAVPFAASAKTLSNTMNAKLQVDTSCKVFTEPLAFGNANFLTGTIDATATIRLRCGPQVAYTVAIDNGQNYNGSRRMYGGTFGAFQLYVPYQIYRNFNRDQLWGATLGTMVAGTTPANGQVNLTAYGRVTNTLALPTEYTDVVTVTVNF